jgi:uncharacterized protein (TIGR01370 family)
MAVCHHRFLILLFLVSLNLLVASGVALSAGTCPQPSRTSADVVDSYIVYYGEGELERLKTVDLVIIQPDTLDPAQLCELRAGGTQAVAYLSVGEVEPYRAWYSDGRVDPEWILGENTDWGSYHVHAGRQGWQDLMIAITGEYLAQGFDGVFLDTVDTAELYPQTARGMVTLITRLRAAYPEALIIQNRGLAVIDKTAPLIDGLMFEDLSTGYDFESEQYTVVPVDTDFVERLTLLRDETGIFILSLDYVEPGDAETARRAEQTAREYGFIPFVSEISLQTIPIYGE